MVKFLSAFAIMFLTASIAIATAQDDDAASNDFPQRVEGPVLIDDPEPVETEHFLAQGSASAEIVDDDELRAEADALAALSGDMEGDMAAMTEASEG